MEYNKLLGRVRPQGVEQRSHSSAPCQSNSPPLCMLVILTCCFMMLYYCTLFTWGNWFARWGSFGHLFFFIFKQKIQTQNVKETSSRRRFQYQKNRRLLLIDTGKIQNSVCENVRCPWHYCVHPVRVGTSGKGSASCWPHLELSETLFPFSAHRYFLFNLSN